MPSFYSRFRCCMAKRRNSKPCLLSPRSPSPPVPPSEAHSITNSGSWEHLIIFMEICSKFRSGSMAISQAGSILRTKIDFWRSCLISQLSPTRKQIISYNGGDIIQLQIGSGPIRPKYKTHRGSKENRIALCFTLPCQPFTPTSVWCKSICL